MKPKKKKPEIEERLETIEDFLRNLNQGNYIKIDHSSRMLEIGSNTTDIENLCSIFNELKRDLNVNSHKKRQEEYFG